MKLKVSHGPYSCYLTYLVLTKNVNKSQFNFDLGRRIRVENILYRFPGRFGDGVKKEEELSFLFRSDARAPSYDNTDYQQEMNTKFVLLR